MQRYLTYLGISGAICMVGFAIWIYSWRGIEKTSDAYVQADFIHVCSEIPGHLSAVYASECDRVEKGASLATLDGSDYIARLEGKKAAFIWAVRQYQQAKQEVAQSQSYLELCQAELTKAQFDYTRREQLMNSRVISAEEFEQAKMAFGVKKSAFEQALAQFQTATLLAQAGKPEDHPLVLRAKEELRQAMLDYRRLNILSPVDGVVAKRQAMLGSAVTPSKPLFIIANPECVWVEANFKETQLEYLGMGQQASIEADIYGTHVIYDAKVIGIGSSAGNVFALLPPQNATGNWIKIVQRVPVRLEINSEQLKKNPLCVGASVSVTIYTTSAPQGIFAGSLHATRQTTDLFTDIYQQVTLDLDAFVQKTIKTIAASGGNTP